MIDKKIYYLIIIAIGTILFLPLFSNTITAKEFNIQDPSSVSLTDGLVLYFDFEDGTPNDKSGYGNHGIIHHSPEIAQGIQGQGMQFGGIYDPDYITVPNSESLSFSDDFTLSVWFNIQSHTSMGESGGVSEYGKHTFLAKAGDRTGFLFKANRFESDGFWYPSVHNGQCCGSENYAIFTPPGTGVEIDEWHMATFVQSDGTAKLYLDGVLQIEVSSDTFNLNDNMSDSDIYIGREISMNPSDFWYPLNGILDEIRIYNRRLSIDEVDALYLQDAPSLSITGHVEDGFGKPIQGVTVSTNTGVSTTSNANGGYRLSGLSEAAYTITPSLENSQFEPNQKVVELPNNRSDHNFLLKSTISGQVRDSNGDPLSGVNVIIGPSGSGFTQEDGNYSIYLPPGLSGGTYRVSASKPGYKFSGPVSVTIPPNQDSVDFNELSETTDTTPPTGFIVSPGNNETITPTGVEVSANVQDNIGGSGISRVEFYTKYNGKWQFIGERVIEPYGVYWIPPNDLQTQTISFAIYAYDNAGNVSADLANQRQAIYMHTSTEVWIENRAYLNQLALGTNGWEMCSMASIAMVLSSFGEVENDFASMKTVAQELWDSGLREPGVTQLANHIKNNYPNLEATTVLDQDKDKLWDWIKAWVNAGYPVILNSHRGGGALTSYGHYIVVVGYAETEDPIERQIIVYDPFGRWEGIIDQYDENSNTPEPPTGVKGRWNYYTFNDLGTTYLVMVEPVYPAKLNNTGQDMSMPDEFFILDSKSVVTYLGHGQSKYPVNIFLPNILR